jgi:hypothetical protein
MLGQWFLGGSSADCRGLATLIFLYLSRHTKKDGSGKDNVQLLALDTEFTNFLCLLQYTEAAFLLLRKEIPDPKLLSWILEFGSTSDFDRNLSCEYAVNHLTRYNTVLNIERNLLTSIVELHSQFESFGLREAVLVLQGSGDPILVYVDPIEANWNFLIKGQQSKGFDQGIGILGFSSSNDLVALRKSTLSFPK